MTDWTCQRVQDGRKCGAKNPRRYAICRACGKKSRPPYRGKARIARDAGDGSESYEAFIARNGGEHCGICGRGRPASGRKLHRDHDHTTGAPRGLLCFPCNHQLRTWATIDWMRRAIAYLQRHTPP